MCTSSNSTRACFPGKSPATRCKKSIRWNCSRSKPAAPDLPHRRQALRRRRRVFVPVAAVLSLLLVAGLFLFVTYEQTAITTVPRQEIEIFAPITPTQHAGTIGSTLRKIQQNFDLLRFP